MNIAKWLYWPVRTPSAYRVRYREWVTLAALFVIGLALNNTIYLPLYGDINFLDEIVYVSTGKNLLDGIWWHYSRGPLISFIYAIIYPFANLFDNWLLISDVIGRFLAYSLLFFAAWLIGREMQFRRLMHPLVMVGFLAVIPPYLIEITNPSHVLFMAFTAFSFWSILVYARTQSRRILLMGGILMGLALMVRPDIVTAAAFVVITLLSTRYWRSRKVFVSTVALAAAPMVLMISVYIMAFGLKTGNYSFGASGKMYNTFEAAQQILVDTKDMFDFDAAAKGKEESEKYFGTAQENHHSVLRAIARNPARFAELVWVNTVTRSIPMFQIAYSGRVELRAQVFAFSWLVGFFALRGLIELFRRRQWAVLLATLLLPAQIFVYLITISFPGYLQFPYYIIFMLMAVGIAASVGNLSSRLEQLFAAVVFLSIYAGSAAQNNSTGITLALAGAAIFAVAALLPAWREKYPLAVPALLVLCLMMLNLPEKNRIEWPGPKNGYELQAKYLSDNFPELTPTLSFPCPAAVLAKMDWRGIGTEIRDIKSTADMKKVLEAQNIQLVLVDPFLTEQNIYNWATSIEKYGKGYLRQVWQSEDGKFKVYTTPLYKPASAK